MQYPQVSLLLGSVVEFGADLFGHMMDHRM